MNPPCTRPDTQACTPGTMVAPPAPWLHRTDRRLRRFKFAALIASPLYFLNYWLGKARDQPRR